MADWKSVKDRLPEISETDERRERIIQTAAEVYGEAEQSRKLTEEMAELTVAICHYWESRATTDDIAQEIADVRIMLRQAEHIYHCADAVEDWTGKKIDRLGRRLNIIPDEREDMEE